MLGAAFSQKQVVVAVLLVDMRSFGISSAETCPQVMYLAQLLARLHINLTYLDVSLFPKEIAFALVEEECGVATAYGEVYHDGFGPLAGRIVGPDIEMTARGEDRCHHVEPSLVIADGRRIDAIVAIGALQDHL